jgi:hypothetical protein
MSRSGGKSRLSINEIFTPDATRDTLLLYFNTEIAPAALGYFVTALMESA